MKTNKGELGAVGVPRWPAGRWALGSVLAVLGWVSSPATVAASTLVDLGSYGDPNGFSRGSVVGDDGQVAGSAESVINGFLVSRATVWNGANLTTLSTLGGSDSWANDMNAAGTVVGGAYTANNAAQRATLWSGGATTDLGTLGGNASEARGLNNAGQVVGWASVLGDAASHATLWSGGSATDLGTLGGQNSQAAAINATGQVVGWSDGSDGVRHATQWSGTTATDLGLAGGTQSWANAVNGTGAVVGGAWLNASVEHAMRWQNGSVVDLGTLGGNQSEARDIDSTGRTVGWAQLANGASHATLWNGTTAVDLNTFLDPAEVAAGWVLTAAYGISDTGWVTGTMGNGWRVHGFLLSVTPVPEPSSVALMLAGLGVLGAVRRRQAAAHRR